MGKKMKMREKGGEEKNQRNREGGEFRPVEERGY